MKSQNERLVVARKVVKSQTLPTESPELQEGNTETIDCDESREEEDKTRESPTVKSISQEIVPDPVEMSGSWKWVMGPLWDKSRLKKSVRILFSLTLKDKQEERTQAYRKSFEYY